MRLTSLLLLAVVACGNAKPSTFGDADSGVPDFNTDSGLPNFGDGSADGQTPANACSDAAKLVYLVTAQNELYSFNPATLTLNKIGLLDCPTAATPNSMAVDRNALAYVNTSDGQLFTVDTANAHCSATSYQLGQNNSLIRGMGFSTDTSGGTTDTLYTCTADTLGLSGMGLAKISLPGYKLTAIGDYSNGLAGSECELTGTGDARLFGFFALLSPPKLAEITKTTGATPSPTPLGGVNTSNSYAFSFWGGDFWFYTAQGTGASEVTQYKYSSDKSFSVVIPNTGMTIVGAGVSTCAPLQPPN